MSSVTSGETAAHPRTTPADLREAMSRFATGVIVLSVGGDNIHAMTANAFSSVSLTPPTVLCCVSHSAVMHKAIMSEGRFGVSVLGAEHESLARHFADKKRPLGAEQFDGLAWEPGPLTRSPLLHGALAWLECELATYHDSGDHSIFIGDVVSARNGSDGAGLLFLRGGFQATPPAG
ncbi:flavin reductase family protein [Streptomyces johnsoniae]|uniref:Flavin reductase family protein n=1 Tax=Streptomyces johnsoniae TaxID=3075532 RepID=A0ABU2SCD7_9ACTN|nr:flavin reductase family protein [Streptomyces sp. DSM 41886]MDT0446478.1 flavin reductase family protein [Streptomyces sp. DSM 41886]